MKRYKYVHLLLCNELKFSTRLVEMFSEEENGFDISQQLIVTPYENVYNSLAAYGVHYEPKKLYQLVNMYCEVCDFVILHYLFPTKDILRVKKSNLKKIVWRTWGGDAHLLLSSNVWWKNDLKKLLDPFVKRRFQQFAAVGIANLVDMMDIEEKFGIPRDRMFRLAYADKDADNLNAFLEDLSKKEENQKNSDEKKTINVLVGHSEWDDQIEVMKALEQFMNYPIHLFSVVAYGENKERKNEIIMYGKAMWKDKITFITEFLPFYQYADMIRKIDIGILPKKRSYALGCVDLLLRFHKKIYVSRDGVLRKAFDYDKIPYGVYEEIGIQDFSKFSRSVVYPEESGLNLRSLGYKNGVKKWHDFYDHLERLQEHRCNRF